MAFCSSVPSRRIVGATEVTERFMAGAPAICISSMKMYCSTAAFPMPPNSFGQPTPHQPFSKSCAVERLGERAVALVAGLAHLGAQRLGDVPLAERAHLVAPGELLGGVLVAHRRG